MNWPRFDLEAFEDVVDPKVFSRIDNALPGVSLLGMHEDRLAAHVAGNDEPYYLTTVYNDAGDQAGSCSCGHYNDPETGGQFCKHMGAAMKASNAMPQGATSRLEALTSQLLDEVASDLIPILVGAAVHDRSILVFLEGRKAAAGRWGQG